MTLMIQRHFGFCVQVVYRRIIGRKCNRMSSVNIGRCRVMREGRVKDCEVWEQLVPFLYIWGNLLN